MNTLLVLIFLLFASANASAFVEKESQTTSLKNGGSLTHHIFKEHQEHSPAPRQAEQSGSDDQDVLPSSFSLIATSTVSLNPHCMFPDGFTPGAILSGNGIRAPPVRT